MSPPHEHPYVSGTLVSNQTDRYGYLDQNMGNLMSKQTCKSTVLSSYFPFERTPLLVTWVQRVIRFQGPKQHHGIIETCWELPFLEGTCFYYIQLYGANFDKHTPLALTTPGLTWHRPNLSACLDTRSLKIWIRIEIPCLIMSPYLSNYFVAWRLHLAFASTNTRNCVFTDVNMGRCRIESQKGYS